MALLSKDALLGASDITEREIELPSIGGSVRVRGLPAAYSNAATSQALEVVTGARGEQSARVNTEKLEVLKVFHGLVDPKLSSEAEAVRFAQQCGPAFKTVVAAIDGLSGLDDESAERTNAAFPVGGAGEAGDDVGVAAAAGNGRPDLPVRTGA